MLKILFYLNFLIVILCYPDREVPSNHPYHFSESQPSSGIIDCPACKKGKYCGNTSGQSIFWTNHIQRYGNAYCYNNNNNWLYVDEGKNISNYWFYANSFVIGDGENIGTTIYMNGPEVVEIEDFETNDDNKNNEYNIYFGCEPKDDEKVSDYEGNVYRSFYLTNREDENSRKKVNGFDYYKVDQCKMESDLRENKADKITCVAFYDPPEVETHKLSLNSEHPNGRFIMDYDVSKHTPQFISFKGITEVEFRGLREYNYCSVYNGDAKLIYLGDGFKLDMSLCENQRNLEYTYNFLGSSAQLKFNQDTTMNLVVSNKNLSITFETLSTANKYKLNIKDVTIDTYELILNLQGNYDFNFRSIILTNGGKFKLLNSPTINLSSIYHGNCLLMCGVNIAADSVEITSLSEKSITLEGEKISISSQCTNGSNNYLEQVIVNNVSNSQIAINLTGYLAFNTTYEGLKLGIYKNNSDNKFHMDWTVYDDNTESNIKLIESNDISTINFSDSGLKKNITVGSIISDAVMDISQMINSESQLKINNIKTEVEALKLIINDLKSTDITQNTFKNNILIDAISINKHENFTVAVVSSSTKKDYRTETIELKEGAKSELAFCQQTMYK